jgi:hypothetical protein
MARLADFHRQHASTLSEDFQVFCCKLHAQHSSWQLRCKYQQVNKVKGQLCFPLKTKPPSGDTTGGIPPPRKNGPIFSQKLASSPTTPQPKPQTRSDIARVAKRERRASQR